MPDLRTLISQAARQRGLDPAAVLSIASVEGGLGAPQIGDQGTSYGPFQLHEGGALPSQFTGRSAAASAFANSPAGVNYALDAIQKVAGGLTGREAISAIASQFERPADVPGEIAKASSRYGQFSGLGTGPGLTGPPGGFTPSLPAPPPSGPSLSALANLGVFSPVAPRTAGPGAPTSGVIAGPLASLAAMGALPSMVPSSSVPLGGAASGGVPKLGRIKLGDPIPNRYLTSAGGEHPTEGLDGFPARDYFAKSGAPAVAPVTGKVVKLSGHDPSEGPIEGPHGPFGWSVYLQGDDGRVYYMTHLGSRDVKVGETVRAGQRIGTVGDYAQYGTPSHIHMGVSTPGVTAS